MFSPPSLQRDYTLCSEHDDALDLPVVPVLADEAPPEDVEHAKKLAEDRALKLKIARDKGEWSTLIKPGRTPARFHFRQLPRSSVHWWLGEIERHEWTHVESLELLFRLACKGIDCTGIKAQFETDGGGRELLSVDTLDSLYRLNGDDGTGPRIVVELGSIVADKVTTRGVRPLS